MVTMPSLPAILVSLLSGFFVAFMVILNAVLGTRVGILESAFTVHLVGGVFGLGLLLLYRGVKFSLSPRIPKHLLLGGVMGVVIVLLCNLIVPRLGMVLTMSLFLVGNLVFAITADHFGFFGLAARRISFRRLAGLAMAIGGLLLVL